MHLEKKNKRRISSMVAEDRKYFHLQIKDSLNSFQILTDNNHFSFHSHRSVWTRPLLQTQVDRSRTKIASDKKHFTDSFTLLTTHLSHTVTGFSGLWCHCHAFINIYAEKCSVLVRKNIFSLLTVVKEKKKEAEVTLHSRKMLHFDKFHTIYYKAYQLTESRKIQ